MEKPLPFVPAVLLASRYKAVGMEGEGKGSGSKPKRGNHVKKVQLRTRVTTSAAKKKKVKGLGYWIGAIKDGSSDQGEHANEGFLL